jgi:transposase InsO family protein
VVIDLVSRRVVGWAMRDDLAAELALSALRMALEARRPAPGLLHHADRGVQYACGEYRDLLEAHGLRAGMSARQLLGQCRRGKLLRQHRNVVQSPPSALDLRLSQSHAVRSPAPRCDIIIRNSVSTKPSRDQPLSYFN